MQISESKHQRTQQNTQACWQRQTEQISARFNFIVAPDFWFRCYPSLITVAWYALGYFVPGTVEASPGPVEDKQQYNKDVNSYIVYV